MSGGGDVVCTGWLRKSPPEKKLRRYVSTGGERARPGGRGQGARRGLAEGLGVREGPRGWGGRAPGFLGARGRAGAPRDSGVSGGGVPAHLSQVRRRGRGGAAGRAGRWRLRCVLGRARRRRRLLGSQPSRKLHTVLKFVSMVFGQRRSWLRGLGDAKNPERLPPAGLGGGGGKGGPRLRGRAGGPTEGEAPHTPFPFPFSARPSGGRLLLPVQSRYLTGSVSGMCSPCSKWLICLSPLCPFIPYVSHIHPPTPALGGDTAVWFALRTRVFCCAVPGSGEIVLLSCQVVLTGC